MTNGEKIIEMFPNAEINYGLRGIVAVTFIHKTIFDLDWWNDEYKELTNKIDCDNTDCNNCVNHKYCDYESNKSENSTSSDCVDRHSVDLLAYRYLKEPTDNHVAFYEDFLDLPSVTPIRPKGHWINHSDEGYVECPKCGSATNCDDNITDLHFCFSCGAEMESEVEE